MSNCSLVFFHGDVLRCDDVGSGHQHVLAPGTPPSDPQVGRGVRTLRWPLPRTLRWPRTGRKRRTVLTCLNHGRAMARVVADAWRRTTGGAGAQRWATARAGSGSARCGVPDPRPRRMTHREPGSRPDPLALGPSPRRWLTMAAVGAALTKA